MNFKEEQRDYIIDMFNDGRRLGDIAFEYHLKYGDNISNEKIRKLLENEGYTIPKGGHRFGVKERDFREAYRKSKGVVEKIVSLTGMSREAVISRCNLLKLI